MHKRGLSDIVVTVLVVLLAMAAIALIWKFALPLINKVSSLDTDIYSTRLSVMPGSVSYDPNTDSISLNVARDAGGGEVSGFMVGLTDQDGNVKVFRKNISVEEYETKKLQLNFIDLTIYDVLSVTITPIFRSNATNAESLGIPIVQPIANKTPYNFPVSLKAHWKFNQGSGCTDFVSSINCTAVGSASYDYTTKKIGTGSANLSGNGNDYFESLNDAVFTTNSLTIIAWVNPRSLTQNGFSSIVNKSTSTTGFILGYDRASSTWQLRTRTTGNQNIVSIPGDSTLNTWNFLAASYDSVESKIYYNSEIASYNNLYQLQFSTVPLRIGSEFNGNVDEVMFFNRVLTPQEIDNIRKKYRG